MDDPNTARSGQCTFLASIVVFMSVPVQLNIVYQPSLY